MLVPVQGGVASLQKRNRQIHEQQAALATVPIPDVYIFNVGPREWRGIGAGKSYVIPACPKGREYSEPVPISALCPSEIDLADGGNNMGVIMDAGMSGTRMVAGESKTVIGVANDIIGTNSTSPACGVNTTNGEWLGVFVTPSEVPTKEELETARGKLRERAQMIYAQGKQIVEQNTPENPIGSLMMQERKLYNEAAAALGYKALWGDGESAALDNCPECREPIKQGANFCKHCQQAIDPASVSARARKRERDAQKMLKEEEAAS